MGEEVAAVVTKVLETGWYHEQFSFLSFFGRIVVKFHRFRPEFTDFNGEKSAQPHNNVIAA